MPCCQVFEPLVQSGHLLISLGFSERAEHAHRKQGRLPVNKMLGQRISSNHGHGRGKTSYTGVFFPAKRVIPAVSGRPLSYFTDEGFQKGNGLNHSSKPITIQVEDQSLPSLHDLIQSTNHTCGAFADFIQEFRVISF